MTNLSSIDDFSIVVLNDSSPIGNDVESKNSASVVVEEAGEENT